MKLTFGRSYLARVSKERALNKINEEKQFISQKSDHIKGENSYCRVEEVVTRYAITESIQCTKVREHLQSHVIDYVMEKTK